MYTVKAQMGFVIDANAWHAYRQVSNIRRTLVGN